MKSNVIPNTAAAEVDVRRLPNARARRINNDNAIEIARESKVRIDRPRNQAR